MATADTHHHSHGHHHHAPNPGAGSGEKARDPVCGMTVPANSPHRMELNGKTHLFCCEGCRASFAANPSRYLGQPLPAHFTAPAAPAAALADAIYTCPMHPEIRQQGPGDCPICGMALEPSAGAAGMGAIPELRAMIRRFQIGLAFALPLVVLDMAADFPRLGLGRLIPPGAMNGVELVLASPAVLWAGFPLLRRAWDSLKRRAPNMFTLIGLGVGASYLESLAATFAPGLFPAALRGAGGLAPVYYEPAAVITVLVLLGQVLELRARERTGGAIRALLDLSPRTARRIGADGRDQDILLAEIRIGDRLMVRPGETVPTDGTIVEGRASLDESMITGEAMPVEKGPGDAVIGGTMIEAGKNAGAFTMRADKVGAETVLAHIVALVAEAQRSRAPIQRLADRVSAWFVPGVIAIALLSFVAWMILGPHPSFAFALSAAVSVVIVACPCALGLATPMSVMVGIGRGAQAGILIRDAEALEKLGRFDTLVIDKTGTLTEGRPRVTAILPAGEFDADGILALAAALERWSEHPLARAILAAAIERNTAVPQAAGFRAEIGKGVLGSVAGREVRVGALDPSEKLPDKLAAQSDQWRRGGASAVGVWMENKLAGLIAIADPVRPGAKAALDRLRAEGVRVIMATGDHSGTARAVSEPLGLGEVEAGLSPAGKIGLVRRLQEAGRVVAMAGDGINDAAALAQADIGIAMGTGSDIAIRGAGITLLKGDLSAIARARTLGSATMRNIRQNLALAFLYNLICVPVAAGVLYPAFGLLLSPMVAAAAMSLSSVSVIANALRLRMTRM